MWYPPPAGDKAHVGPAPGPRVGAEGAGGQLSWTAETRRPGGHRGDDTLASRRDPHHTCQRTFARFHSARKRPLLCPFPCY